MYDSKCIKTNNNDCLQCEDRMWLWDGDCHENSIDFCLQQENETHCTMCEEGRYLLFGKCITLESLNCEDYDETTMKCKSCNKGDKENFERCYGCSSCIRYGSSHNDSKSH